MPSALADFSTTVIALTILVAGVAGIYVSYYAKTAAGASIVGCLVLLYLLAAAWAAIPRRQPVATA